MCSVLQFIKQFFLICFVLHVICYLLCILHIAYVSVGLDQRCLIGAKSGFGMRGFQGHLSHAVPPSLSISLLRPTLHIEMLLQNCSRTMQKRVQPATIKMACSPLLASTPTALKQHRDQSIRPVPLSDSDYSDIYQ